MIDYLFFVLGFLLLIKGAEFLVLGASSIARHLKVSELFIGLTVVAFGTSLPELVVNISAGTNLQVGMGVGNILGSNIANILLILGVAAIIYPLSIRKDFWKHAMFSLFSVCLLLMFVISNFLNYIAGIIMIIIFLFYLFWSFKQDTFKRDSSATKMSLFSSIIFSVAGALLLLLGGNWVINGASIIAVGFGISDVVVGLVLVAIGTSLPELVTAIVAAKAKKTEMVVGEIVGSNIFNILWVFGATSFIYKLVFDAQNLVSIYILLVISFCFFIYVLFKKSISFRAGMFFVGAYVAYLLYLFL